MVGKMRISFGCDHGGLELKNNLVQYLKASGHEIMDFGTYTQDSCDYPDYVYQAVKALSTNEVDRAIVLCTTGIGASIVANKVKGVRCSLVHSKEVALLTREHNDSNCLAIGAITVSLDLAKEIVDIWLNTDFSNMEKHQNRINKISEIEVKENE